MFSHRKEPVLASPKFICGISPGEVLDMDFLRSPSIPNAPGVTGEWAASTFARRVFSSLVNSSIRLDFGQRDLHGGISTRFCQCDVLSRGYSFERRVQLAVKLSGRTSRTGGWKRLLRIARKLGRVDQLHEPSSGYLRGVNVVVLLPGDISCNYRS